jgi:predicted transcriptional regulator
MIRDAVAEGAAEADRGELISGDDVFAEIDRTIADMRRTARRA